MHINTGTDTIPTATVSIKENEKIYQESSIGDGPVDAAFNAIEKALNIKPSVESYNVRSVTGGRQAMGEAIVRIRSGENSFTGRGVSTDIMHASAKAYLQAINMMKIYEESNLEVTTEKISMK